MSISSEITRLQEAKEDIIDAIEGKGVTVPTGSHYDDFPDLIDAIPQGGSGNPQALKSVTYTPSEAAIADEVTPDSGYDSIKKVNVSVGAIPSNYVGSSVPRKSSSDLTASGATVTAPAGYYSENASKAIPNATLILSDAVINLDGSIEAEVKATSGGYVSQGNHYLTVEDVVTMKGAQTYYPSSSDQAITAWQYLSGDQTIKGVTTTNLLASNIKKDVVVEVGDSADPDRILSVTGTYEGGGGTDYLPSALQNTLTSYTSTSVTSIRKYGLASCTGLTSVSFPNVTTVGNSVFEECSNLATVSVPNLSVFGQSVFFGCGKIQKIALPGLKKTNGLPIQVFRNCSGMTVCDVGECGSLANQVFWGASVLNVLILRRSDAICVNGGGGLFASTPFDTGGAGGTIYIPKALYDHLGDGTALDYQNASNWSVVYGRGVITWAQIEGSYYETHYGDDTTIPT